MSKLYISLKEEGIYHKCGGHGYHYDCIYLESDEYYYCCDVKFNKSLAFPFPVKTYGKKDKLIYIGSGIGYQDTEFPIDSKDIIIIDV